MAQDLIINSVVYSNCPEVDIPKQGGGTAKFYDTSTADISAGDVLTGKTAFGASGSVSGNMANNGSTSGEISTKSGTVSLKASAISDLTSGNLLSGKTVLGVSGSLAMPSISQDGTTKVLSIS